MMSFVTHDLDARSVTLQTAILLYGSGGGYEQLRYATIHPVDCAPGAAPVIRAGRPADRDSLRQVAAGLLESNRTRSGVLPETLLSVGPEHVVWWQRPGKRTYFFNTRVTEEDRHIAVGQRNGEGLTPGLIFAAKGQKMWVFAVKGENRPDVSTPLCHAPLMNVWDSGTVCTGSMPLPDSTMADSVARWERGFWESAFSHPNHPKPVNYKGGIHAFSRDLLDGKFRKFPERVLRPIKGMTLGLLVDKLDADRMPDR